jgi:hypothetical protein
MAEVDAGGELIKDSGLHQADAFRYLLEYVFDGFLKSPEKFIRPITRPRVLSPIEAAIEKKFS